MKPMPFVLAAGLAMACLFVVLNLGRRDELARLRVDLAERRLSFLARSGVAHAAALALPCLPRHVDEPGVVDLLAAEPAVKEALASSAIPFEQGTVVGRYRVVELRGAVRPGEGTWDLGIEVEALLEPRPDDPSRIRSVRARSVVRLP